MKKINLQAIAALGLALALPAALCWYYDVYVNWQPSVYPFAITAVVLGSVLLTLLTLRARGERKVLGLVWKILLSVIVFMAALLGVSGIINNGIYQGRSFGTKIAAGVVLPLCAAQIFVLFALLLAALGKVLERAQAVFLSGFDQAEHDSAGARAAWGVGE